jgi:hypothetical protein
LPKRCFEVTMFLSCAAKDMKVLLIAAIPELKAVAWAASVRAATRRSRLVTVGFSTRE